MKIYRWQMVIAWGRLTGMLAMAIRLVVSLVCIHFQPSKWDVSFSGVESSAQRKTRRSQALKKNPGISPALANNRGIWGAPQIGYPESSKSLDHFSIETHGFAVPEFWDTSICWIGLGTGYVGLEVKCKDLTGQQQWPNSSALHRHLG